MPVSRLAKRSQVLIKAPRPQRIRVAEEVAAILRNAILKSIDGAFAPGTQLTEVSTSRELGVSRTTLREAFALLAQEGVLTVSPHRGTYVSEIGPDDVREIFRVRRTLELSAVEQIGHAPTDTLSLLKDAIQQMAIADDAGRWQDIVSADLLFHKRLVASLGSETLSQVYNQVAMRLRLCMLVLDHRSRTQPDSIISEARSLPIVDSHREIVELIRASEARRAKTRLARILRLDERYLVAVFSRMRTSDAAPVSVQRKS
jgi:DNA-binding GntR family transcriptional regulator